MASKAHPFETHETVALAAQSLMAVNVWAGASYVSLPFFYPSGTTCVVKVERVGSQFIVSDYGATFREVDHLGLGSSFTKSAKKVANEVGAVVKNNEITCSATLETLAMTMATIAQVSSEIAAKMVSKVGTSAEQQIQAELVTKLERIFGREAVQVDEKLIGQSAKDWTVDAVVYRGGRQIAFDFVRNSAQSVYAVAAKFHDIRAIEAPPLVVAVVEDKQALGFYHSILTQAGRVIEADQADEVFERAVA